MSILDEMKNGIVKNWKTIALGVMAATIGLISTLHEKKQQESYIDEAVRERFDELMAARTKMEETNKEPEENTESNEESDEDKSDEDE